MLQIEILNVEINLSFHRPPPPSTFAIKNNISMPNYTDNTFTVRAIPGARAAAAFSPKTSEVFKEEHEVAPVWINNQMQYVPWGADNKMPFNIIDLVESDETLATCQMFNAEVCYGSGLIYDASTATAQVQGQVDDFFADNDMASYFLGVCQDFKHFGFAVSVIILNEDASRIVRIVRKQACYVRFAPADKSGVIPYILYANWRNAVSADEVERIELLNPQSPLTDLQARLKVTPKASLWGKGMGNRELQAAHSAPNSQGSIPISQSPITKNRKFAVLSRIPTPDNTYYPIPYYAALFKGKWYNIKQLIGIAKEAKLKNSAPIKYHIEIANSFWNNIFKVEGITDRVKQQERVNQEKDNIINFLTGMENSGKVLFSTFYVSPNGEEQHDVVINKIETDKEGGDWATDIIEAVNMMCFTMRVHSNLVGSVPGKTQTNNSGSDKRELYTIAQALQKPYHDLLFNVHRLIIRYNGWKGARPDCPFIQLTTLDENRDAKSVTLGKGDGE